MAAPVSLASLLIDTLRANYQRLQASVITALGESSSDIEVLTRVCSELDSYRALFIPVRRATSSLARLLLPPLYDPVQAILWRWGGRCN